MSDAIEWVESSGNLFADVGFSKETSNRLQFRSFLMVALMKYIESESITQVEAAKRLGVTQSRVSNLVNFKIELFSTDMLLDMLERAGFSVYEKMEHDIALAIDKPWFDLPIVAHVAA